MTDLRETVARALFEKHEREIKAMPPATWETVEGPVQGYWLRQAASAIVAVLEGVKEIIATVRASGEEQYRRLKMFDAMDGHGNACTEIDEAIDALIARHKGAQHDD